MGIILGSATTEYLDKSIRNSIDIDKKSIREILNYYKENIADFGVEETEIDEILNSDEIFAWGISSENGEDVLTNISRGDTLYLSENESNAFQYRAFVTTIIRNSKGLSSLIWEDSDDMTVCFLENVQPIDIEKEEHLFYFGQSKKSTLSEPIYIKDTYQELLALKEDEFKEVVPGEISQEDYKALLKAIR